MFRELRAGDACIIATAYGDWRRCTVSAVKTSMIVVESIYRFSRRTGIEITQSERKSRMYHPDQLVGDLTAQQHHLTAVSKRKTAERERYLRKRLANEIAGYEIDRLEELFHHLGLGIYRETEDDLA